MSSEGPASQSPKPDREKHLERDYTRKDRLKSSDQRLSEKAAEKGDWGEEKGRETRRDSAFLTYLVPHLRQTTASRSYSLWPLTFWWWTSCERLKLPNSYQFHLLHYLPRGFFFSPHKTLNTERSRSRSSRVVNPVMLAAFDALIQKAFHPVILDHGEWVASHMNSVALELISCEK